MSCPPTSRRMGWVPMQGIWWANRPISSQPAGQTDFRAVCGVAKSGKADSLALDFAPSIPSRKFICAPPYYLRTSSKGNTSLRARARGLALGRRGARQLLEQFGAFKQFFQARFLRIVRLAGMDDGH